MRDSTPHPPTPAPAAPVPRPPTTVAPPASPAVRIPDPGPPPPRTCGGIARSATPTRNAFMTDVDVTQAPYTVGNLSGEAHLQWLRAAYADGQDVKAALERLADRVAAGTHVVLTGPDTLTRNVDAALRSTLQARHGLTGKTLWTHDAAHLTRLEGSWQATLILGGREATTYTLHFQGEDVTVHTTRGERHYTRATLADVLHGTYFTGVHPAPPQETPSAGPPRPTAPPTPGAIPVPVVVLPTAPTPAVPTGTPAWEVGS